MPLPFILAAAEAGAVVRVARSVLAEWNRLDADAKRSVQREADDVRRSLLEVGRALGARLHDPNDSGISWDEGRRLALSPRPEFLLARQIVDVVLGERELDEAQLRARVAGGADADLAAALAIAEEDGFIARVAPDRWRITEFADQVLLDSADILFMEQAVNEHIRRVGLAGRNELAIAAGSPDSNAAEFLAAVERALVAGAIEWLGPGMYGLPRDQLAAMQPPPPDDRGGARASSKELKTMLVDLKREIDELRQAVATARAAVALPPDEASPAAAPAAAALAAGAAPGAAPASDPFAKLRTLKALLDEGVITAADFERKKADLLGAL